METASKETAKEEKKSEATTEAMAKQADAAPPPATVAEPSGRRRSGRQSRGHG